MRHFMFLLAGWLVASAITGLVGPMSTFGSMTLGIRMMYWGGIIGVALILGELIRLGVRRVPFGSEVEADLVGSGLMTVLFGAAVTAFNARVLNDVSFTIDDFLVNAGIVLVVCVGVVLARAYVRHLRATGAAEAPDALRVAGPFEADGSDSPAPLAQFLQGVDPAVARTLRWVEADDHYLRVHSALGSERVLMRFRDALNELDELDGFRVHRSHWIAREAVMEVRSQGRRHVAILSCGTEVPVSRTYLTDLRAAGLMDRDAA